jgi:long-chain acyl-CoA synthetase
VLQAGEQAAPEELIAFVRERIAAFKYPRVVHLVEELPLGPSGKVLKRELTRVHGGRRMPARSQADRGGLGPDPARRHRCVN